MLAVYRVLEVYEIIAKVCCNLSKRNIHSYGLCVFQLPRPPTPPQPTLRLPTRAQPPRPAMPACLCHRVTTRMVINILHNSLRTPRRSPTIPAINNSGHGNMMGLCRAVDSAISCVDPAYRITRKIQRTFRAGFTRLQLQLLHIGFLYRTLFK